MTTPIISYTILPSSHPPSLPTSTSTSFSSSGPASDWPKILIEIQRQLPLKNLHWKSNTRSIRTIQQLDLKFVPLSECESVAGTPTSATAAAGTGGTGGLAERPYCNLLFVLSDDNDLYRSTLRALIREWLDQLQRQNREWLIVHVSSSGRSGGSAGNTGSGTKFYQRKGSVVDKIKADFNTDKRDRCVQITPFPLPSDPTSWAEFTTKLKEGIITTFGNNVQLYEEDVKKADSQRQLSGWNYLNFFGQKEALASCFVSLALYEDSLIQYDELEASFFQTLKENPSALPSLSSSSSPLSSSFPLLPPPSTTTSSSITKPLSTTTGEISIFDLRIYLFSKQAEMLKLLGRVEEIAKRGARFVGALGGSLRTVEKSLGPNFVESWTYKSCLELVEACTLYSSSSSSTTTTTNGFEAVKAELLELGRKQLDKIGLQLGYLPLLHPFSMSLNESTSPSPPSHLAHHPTTSTSTSTTTSQKTITRPDLLAAMTSEEAFDKLYVDLTNKCIESYRKSGRKRLGLKLNASLAALEDLRSHHSSAQKLFSHLPSHYTSPPWPLLESKLLTSCVKLQKKLEMGRERLLSTLALVRAGVDGVGWGFEGDDDEEGEEGEKRAGELMKDVRDLSGELTKDFAAISFPTFRMRLKSDRGSTAIDEDGLTVKLVVRNFLPCESKIDEVRLKFSSADGDQIWFTAAGCTLKKDGDTEVVLFSPTPVHGKLLLELSQIRFSRIIFQYSHRPSNLKPLITSSITATTSNTATLTATEQPFVHFPRDPHALDVFTEFPKIINLDEPRQLILCVSTGRNELVRVDIKVGSLSSDFKVGVKEVMVIEGVAKLSVGATEDTFSLEGVKMSSVTKIQLPLIGNVLESSVEISLSAEYFTSKRPTTRRVFRRTLNYNVSLPLAVNVQDYFRQDCLLSKFVVVTADVTGGLRIKSVELIAEELDIKPCRKLGATPIALFPNQASNFLFRIERPEKKEEGGSPSMRLKITYCTMEGEFEAKVKRSISLALGTSPLKYHEHWFQEAVLDQTDAIVNLHSPGAAIELVKAKFNEEKWRRLAREQFGEEGELEGVIEVLRAVHGRLTESDVTAPVDAWWTLTIPIQLPSLTILNLVHFLPSSRRTEVGQPLRVTLSIRSTFAWARDALPKRVALTYDINASLDDWLISGRKKGEFEGEEGEENEILLTLIPLRAGDLFLPSVAIKTSPTRSDPNWTCETQHLNAGTTVEILPITARTTFNIALEAHMGVEVH